MSGEYDRLPGQALRLNLSVDDLNPSLFVRAFLYNQAGAALGTPFVNLAHTANGIYVDNTAVMPTGVDQVKAKYVPYMDAGYSIVHPSYTAGFDTFDKKELVPVTFPDDTVIGFIQDNVILDGRIQDSFVDGVIESDDASGTVAMDQVDGVLEGGSVAGSIEDSEVEGKTEC